MVQDKETPGADEVTVLQSALAETERQLEGCKKAFAEQEAACKKLEAELKTAAAKIKALESALEEATAEEAPASSAPTFRHDNKTYCFKVGKFYWLGNEVTAAEAIQDKGLCAELAKDYPGIVERV